MGRDERTLTPIATNKVSSSSSSSSSSLKLLLLLLLSWLF
jgi:hypothetical protein